MKIILLFLTALIFISVAASGQTKRSESKTARKKTAVSARQPTGNEETVVPANLPAKKNERADAALEPQTDVVPPKKNNQRDEAKARATASAIQFVYEFSQPKFTIKRVLIEHDASGTGKITFQKQELIESLTDPLQISAEALEKIKSLWSELNFLDSTENYQVADKDFSHLGVMKLRREETGKRREAEFNWTENKAAKDLTDEYKKLTEQFIWIFDMNVARENYPLNAPQLVNRFESLLNRNLISDGKQMLPYLREVSDDERLPLIARNHAKKIVERIEKQKDEK